MPSVHVGLLGGEFTNPYLESNRELWNRLTAINVRSRSYNLDGFRKGESSLKLLEVRELGEVRGKSLLHLQCHFGLDTLSWARLGAVVTGVDFSPEAIRLARQLSAELGIPARFIESDLYDLPGSWKTASTSCSPPTGSSAGSRT